MAKNRFERCLMHRVLVTGLIGSVILIGVIVDEIAKRVGVQRRAARQAALDAAGASNEGLSAS